MSFFVLLLNILLETAKEENISRAIKKLYISQQALSKEIANMEASLGISLFVRSQNCIELSSADKAILPVAKAMLECHDRYISILHSVAERKLFDSEFLKRVTDILEKKKTVADAIAELNRQYNVSPQKK